eukprot:Gb_05292 [translate_table: standard]
MAFFVPFEFVLALANAASSFNLHGCNILYWPTWPWRPSLAPVHHLFELYKLPVGFQNFRTLRTASGSLARKSSHTKHTNFKYSLTRNASLDFFGSVVHRPSNIGCNSPRNHQDAPHNRVFLYPVSLLQQYLYT